MFELVLPESELLAALAAPLERSQRPRRLSVGLSRRRDMTELLARPGNPSLAEPNEGELLLWSVSDADDLYPPEVDRLMLTDPAPLLACLAVGIGPLHGKALGFVRIGMGDVRPLTAIRLVGSTMSRMDLGGMERPLIPRWWADAEGLYSRLIGTIGLQSFARLHPAKIAVIGAGGTGSLAATTLARFLGGDGQITVIDPDRFEASNLPAWAAPYAVAGETLVGRYKAEALADLLGRLPDPPRVEAVTASAGDWAAASALKSSDVYVCCVDNPAARAAVAGYAIAYHRPLLDIATGVFLGSGPEDHHRRMKEDSLSGVKNSPLFTAGRLPQSLLDAGARTFGADVRLLLPGVSTPGGGCLQCWNGAGTSSRLLGQPFWEERAGSHFLLNSDAAVFGARLLLDFLTGAGSASAHWQLDLEPGRPPHWRACAPTPTAQCLLCATSGRGDGAASKIGRLSA